MRITLQCQAYYKYTGGDFLKVLMKSVDMICCSNKEGVLTPIKFKIYTENSESKIIKIDRIISRDEEKLAGNRMLIFTAQITLNGVERLLEIKYEVSSCRWFLYKI